MENSLDIEIENNIESMSENEVRDMLSNMIESCYSYVGWPEVQDLMDEPWFEEEAILDGSEDAPSSSYLIPTKYVLRRKND